MNRMIVAALLLVAALTVVLAVTSGAHGSVLADGGLEWGSIGH